MRRQGKEREVTRTERDVTKEQKERETRCQRKKTKNGVTREGGIESLVPRGKENEVTKEGKEWSEKDRKRSLQ